MSNFCRVCCSEKRYDEYHRFYKPCDSCNNKRAKIFYYINKDKIFEKKRNLYHNNKEYFDKYNKKRKSKISDLEYQINTLTQAMKTLKSTTSVV